jgi:hypothetical protein
MAERSLEDDIERVELGRPEPQGKLITQLWRDQLGVETEDEHHLVADVRRFCALLDAHGIAH